MTNDYITKLKYTLWFTMFLVLVASKEFPDPATLNDSADTLDKIVKDCPTRSCRILGCNNIPGECKGHDHYLCAQVCKCDEACANFGDCCYDYWHLCKGSHKLEIDENLQELSLWDKNDTEKFQTTNNSMTSL